MIEINALVIVAASAMLLASGVKVMREYERAVVLRLGRLVAHRGPGVIFVIPGIEKMLRIDLRTVTMDVPSQDVITRDNVSVKVNAVLYFRVVDPNRAVVEVENYLYATSQLAQTTLRSVCGQAELDQLLSDRERINQQIQVILDEQTDPWGIKVVSVEVKHIDLPQEMQRAMARQAEAERDRRAKVINAEGEFQASARLTEAAAIMGEHPIAIQLRFLQTLVEVASEHSSTIVLPIPVDLLSPFVDMAAKRARSHPTEGGDDKA
jgi:regulator of protease activity HflC (stomatin/prohibitin superfamily)